MGDDFDGSDDKLPAAPLPENVIGVPGYTMFSVVNPDGTTTSWIEWNRPTSAREPGGSDT